MFPPINRQYPDYLQVSSSYAGRDGRVRGTSLARWCQSWWVFCNYSNLHIFFPSSVQSLEMMSSNNVYLIVAKISFVETDHKSLVLQWTMLTIQSVSLFLVWHVLLHLHVAMTFAVCPISAIGLVVSTYLGSWYAVSFPICFSFHLNPEMSLIVLLQNIVGTFMDNPWQKILLTHHFVLSPG